MSRKRLLATLFSILLIALFAWSPWLTDSFIKTRATDSFNKAWESVVDGCGTNCKGCGTVSSRRVPFGALVTLEYGCGMMPADSPEYHEHATIFVSTMGTIHGFPTP